MKPKTTLAAVLVMMVAAFVPATVQADPGSAVQADVAQLTTDVNAAQTTLLADLTTVTNDAVPGNRAALKAAIAQFQSDRSTLIPPIKTDLGNLAADLKAARAAHVKGLWQLIKSSVVADRQALREIRKAARQAREAVRDLRHPAGSSSVTSGTTGPTGPTGATGATG